MTKLKYLISSTIISTISLASYADHHLTECKGSVGDVKISVLKTSDFKAQNGECWKHMDGSGLADTKLDKMAPYLNKRIPDMNYRFPRAVPQNGDRKPGHYQPQAILQHRHVIKGGHDGFPAAEAAKYSYGNGTTEIHGTGAEGSTTKRKVGNFNDTKKPLYQIGNVTDAVSHSVDNRPENVAFYFYLNVGQ